MKLGERMTSNVLVEVQNLKKEFNNKHRWLPYNNQTNAAVRDISFTIYQGETFGLVGESGCGKTTIARILMGVYKPTAGKIFFKDKELFKNKSSLLNLRKNMQMIFQNPSASLNPVMTIGTMIREALTVHKISEIKDQKEKSVDLLNRVGLGAEIYNKFPHELSIGQRQRACIARSLAVEPEFLVCDEPVSALDVSNQAQILALLDNLQKKFNLTYLFISHDLRIIKSISTRVAVMYAGKIVELAETKRLFDNPIHPYTRLLLSVLPSLDPNQELRCGEESVFGKVSEEDFETGCVYVRSCREKAAVCFENVPELKKMADNHLTACHLC